MPRRLLKVPDTATTLHVESTPPGVPLVRPLGAADLMLATLRAAPFSGKGWWFEWKYDGFRALVCKTGERVELVSRPGNSLNRAFVDIVAAVAAVPGDFVWDAELTVGAARGADAFARLRARSAMSVPSRIHAATHTDPARLYVFDMLAIGTRDLRGLPLIERKRFLRESFEDNDALVFATGVADAGEWVFEQVIAHDFEGMVAKRIDSPYQRGRSTDWWKIKFSDYSRPDALGFGRAKKSRP